METSSACPHHGFDTWMLVNHFYDGMSPHMKQLVETMCGGNFLSKHPDEAIDFLNYVAETSKAWDEPRPREDEGLRHSSYQGESFHTISEDTLMREKLTILTRRLDEMELKNQHNIYSLNELSSSQPSCNHYQSNGHYGENCQENVQILNQGRPPMNVPFGNSYIQNWKNHSNLPGKPKIPLYMPPTDQQQLAPTSQQQQPLPLSPVEQAILNLSKVVGTIVEEQKVLNVQTSQKIEALESSVNRKLDNMHSEISKLSNQQLQSSEKERAPSQGQHYQNMVNEIGLTEDSTTRTDEVKAVVTLRSGRELKTAVPELVKPAPVVAEPLQEEQISALITEESSGHETGEEPQEPILQPIPMKLNPSATAQPQNNLLPVAPSVDQVYILPSPAPQPTPATKSKPAAPTPKGKSNRSLHVMQNLRKLVAIAQAFATTSKKMVTAYIAWHSGWFGCGFGFGTPGPRHF